MEKKESKKNLFTLGRDFVLTSVFGHSIRFVKGEETYVPPIVQPEAMSIGAAPVERVEEEVEVPPPVLTPEERAAKIFEAIEATFKANIREEFTAAGVPTVFAVGDRTGFKVAAKEIATELAKYHEKVAANKEKAELETLKG